MTTFRASGSRKSAASPFTVAAAGMTIALIVVAAVVAIVS